MTRPNLERPLNYCLMILLFLLPWQAIWIYEERFLNGVKWEYGTLGFYATEGLLWICATLFIIWLINRRFQVSGFRFQVTRDRLFALACLSLISYLLLSTLWSLDQSIAFQHALRIMSAFILFFLLLLGPLSWQTAVKWFVAGTTVQSVIGIWQFLAQSTLEIKWLGLVAHPAWEAGASVVASGEIGRWLRAYGAFPHPNVLGGYLVISIILTLFLIFRLEKYRVSRILYLISLSLQATALFFTFSRSAWIAFAIGLILFISLTKKKSGWGLIPCSLFLILTLIYLPLIQTRLSGTSTNELVSATARLSGYSDAWQLFKLSPWFGVGPGHYTLATYAIDQSRPGWEYQPVHNMPLLILVELGLVGVVLVMVVAATAIRRQLHLLFLMPYLPIVLFDHYLFSTYTGLILSSIYIALLFRTVNEPSVSSFSTVLPHPYPRFIPAVSRLSEIFLFHKSLTYRKKHGRVHDR